MSSLKKFLAGSVPLGDALPLMHTCEGSNFEGIIDTGQFNVEPCGNFIGENLVYFFYGKPAYRVGQKVGATQNLGYLPVCFVLDDKMMPSPTRVAALDSGAFFKNRYEGFFQDRIDIGEFLLDANLESPRKLVNRFYGTNKRYFESRPLQIEIAPTEYLVQEYYGLISTLAATKFDDRASTIEYQVQNPIEIKPGMVKLVILPRPWLDMPKVFNMLHRTWQPEIETYSLHRGCPTEYIGLIYNRVEAFLNTKGLL